MGAASSKSEWLMPDERVQEPQQLAALSRREWVAAGGGSTALEVADGHNVGWTMGHTRRVQHTVRLASAETRTSVSINEMQPIGGVVLLTDSIDQFSPPWLHHLGLR